MSPSEKKKEYIYIYIYQQTKDQKQTRNQNYLENMLLEHVKIGNRVKGFRTQCHAVHSTISSKKTG